MGSKKVVLLGVLGFVGALMLRPGRGSAQTASKRLVRIAEIEVDPQQIDAYKAALREGIEAAIRLEPGVLSLYAVSVKGHPEQVRVVEVYADQAAYQAHLQTLHFKEVQGRDARHGAFAEANRDRPDPARIKVSQSTAKRVDSSPDGCYCRLTTLGDGVRADACVPAQS